MHTPEPEPRSQVEQAGDLEAAAWPGERLWMRQGLTERSGAPGWSRRAWLSGTGRLARLVAGNIREMRQKRTGVLQIARILKGIRAACQKREGEVMTQERLIRPREVAHRLAVSRSTVYRWFWEGKLKGVKITGGTVRILESAVMDKMAEIY